MRTVLYNVNEDATTDPISYYPTVVITGSLGTEDLAQLINDNEPTVSKNDARACMNELRSVCLDLLAWGIWVLFDDFVQIYTGLNVNFGQDYLADIQPKDLESLAYAQSQFVDDTESLITFDLNRYTFPTKPYVDSIQEKKYNTIDHIIGGYGCYVYGQDFGASMDDDETGVWLESPAGNNYQQTNNISFSDNTIIFVPDVTGELGAAGVNSVEHTLTVRGKYDDEVVVTGYDFLCRAINPVNTLNGDNNIFISGNQSGDVVEVISHNLEQGTPIYFYTDGNDIYAKNLINNDEYLHVSVQAGEYALINDDNVIIINIANTTTIESNVSLYNGFLSDLAELENENVTLTLKTINDGSTPFDPGLNKSPGNVSWSLGNGECIINDDNISYSGYTSNAEKTVVIYNINSLDTITQFDFSGDGLTEMFDYTLLMNAIYINFYNNNITDEILDLSILTSLETFTCSQNEIIGEIPDLSLLTSLKIFHCYDNNITGSIPNLSSNTALEDFTCSQNEITGEIPDLSLLTSLEIFYCYDNNITGSIPNLSSNTALVYFGCSDNFITGYSGGLDSCVNLTGLYVHRNYLDSANLSNIIDDLWTIRSQIGSNSCVIWIHGDNNGIPDQDAIDKIEGTGPYIGDGLKDNGCTVTYNS